MDSVTGSINRLPECEICLICTFKPCPACTLATHEQSAFKALTAQEKIHALAYKRLLVTNAKITPLMVRSINKIYEKYPDFDISAVP